jgi:isocitrate/isopropylmalate dehydrogenase
VVEATIAVLAGDGIGSEVTAEGVRALAAVAKKFGHSLEFEHALLGGAAIDATGDALPRSRCVGAPMPCCSVPWAARSGPLPMPR